MKKKVFITILIILILLLCSIGIGYFVYPKDEAIPLARKDIIDSNENTIDNSIDNTISNEITPESNTIISEVELETKINDEIPKKDETIVEKTVSTASTTPNNTTKNTTSSNKNTQKNNIVTNKEASSKATTPPPNIENPKPKEDTTSKSVDNPTETKKATQPTRCTNNNNHSIGVGNSGKWFNSKNDAIAYYNSQVSYWGNWWENSEVSEENNKKYYANCPSGYEVWDCMYCSKWTINFYYR